MESRARKEREVWEVCDALQHTGEKLTYKAIGDKLVELGYCRGSNSDICRYLLTWRQHKGMPVSSDDPRTQRSISVPEIPEDFLSSIEKTVQNALAKAASESKIPASPTSLSASEEGANTLVATLSSKLQQLASEQALKFVHLFEHHEQQFERYLSSLDALRQANTLLSSQLSALRAANTEQLKEKARQIEQLEKSLTQERKKLLQLERLLKAQEFSSS